MPKKTLNIGLIGYRFMGKAHSNAWRQAPRFFDLKRDVQLHTICGRNATEVGKARAQFGWSQANTDWRALVSNPEIDVIDINTPNDSHAEIAIAAAKAGKHVLSHEKRDLGDGRLGKFEPTQKSGGDPGTYLRMSIEHSSLVRYGVRLAGIVEEQTQR